MNKINEKTFNDLLSRIYKIRDFFISHKKLRNILNILVIFALFGFVFFYIIRDWDSIKEIDFTFNITPFIYSILIYGVTYILLIVGWHLIMMCFDDQYKWHQNFYNYAYSYMTKFLPTPAWFFGSRVLLYNNTNLKKENIFIITLLENGIHILAGLAVYSIVQLNPKDHYSFFWLLGCVPIVLTMLKSEFLLNKRFFGEQGNIVHIKHNLPMIILLYLLSWLVAGIFFYYVILIVVPDVTMPIRDLLSVWIISNEVSYLSSLLLGGVGTLREFSMTMLLDKWFDPPIALGITIVSRLVMTISGIIWSLFFMMLSKLYIRIKK